MWVLMPKGQMLNLDYVRQITRAEDSPHLRFDEHGANTHVLNCATQEQADEVRGRIIAGLRKGLQFVDLTPVGRKTAPPRRRVRKAAL